MPTTLSGPVVQITPDELHVDDPAYFANLFVTGGVRKSDAYPGFTRGTGFEGAFFLFPFPIYIAR